MILPASPGSITHRFISSVADAHDRGLEFGAAHPAQITATVESYRRLFERVAGAPVDVERWGSLALDQIRVISPDLAHEIEGMAEGSRIDVRSIAAINARTEVLAAIGPTLSHECSTVVQLREPKPPVAVQTWDWYAAVSDLWLVWEIPQPSGRQTTTLTEYGIVGKIGVNNAGIGVLFNILHHDQDGQGLGAPVHVLARAVLDEAADLNAALVRLSTARVSASSSVTVVAHRGRDSSAISVELNPDRVGYVVPGPEGLLVHTNHFLSTPADQHDTELVSGPDTIARYAMLSQRLSGRLDLKVEDVVTAMDSHLLGGGSTCCHVDPSLPPQSQFETLATVALDLEHGALVAHAGGPCTFPAIHQTRKKTMITLKRIDNMDILTRDVDRLVGFYHGLLGLPFHLPYEAGEEWAAIDLGNLTLYLFKSEVGEHAPRRTAVNPDNAPGYDSIAFEVDDLDDAVQALDGKVEWVDESIQWKHPSGTWYRYRPFFDPDGNMLYVTEPHQVGA